MNYLDEIFEKSNKSRYAKCYIRLCERAIGREIREYTERHHIVPKFAGGGNSRKNLVRLTGREHYLAHLLLTKMFDNKNLQMRSIAALGAFIPQNAHRNLSARQIGLARKAKSISQTGKTFSIEHRNKISSSLSGVKKSPTHIEANRKSHLGKILSAETVEKRTRTAKENRETLKLENLEMFERKRFERISKTSKGHVFIDGKEFPSIGEAARFIGRNAEYVKNRVRSDSFPTWIFIPKVL